MNWNDLTQTYLQTYIEQVGSAEFQAVLPNLVGSAELRIYRECEFMATHGQNSSLNVTAGQRTLSLLGMTGQTVGGYPVANGYPVGIEGVSVIEPFGTFPRTGGRYRLQPASIDFVDNMWPNEATTGIPQYYTMLDHATMIIAPTPDQSYDVEISGSWRPAPMSPTQLNSWLGDNLPDLLFAAVMIEALGYQRDYGAQSDDPQNALSWKAQYDAAKASALTDETKRRGF